MANPEHLAKLKEGIETKRQSNPGKRNEGVKAWNNWRQEYPMVRPDLSKADLNSLDFCDILRGGVNLEHADLTGANLNGAMLHFANFFGANLAGANLAGAWLTFASFSFADLFGANLTEAHIFGVSFDHARLDTSDMTRADLSVTSFGDNDLSTVNGLDCVEHAGPCTIGVDTIQRF